MPILGLFYAYTRSLSGLYYVFFTPILGLFYAYTRSIFTPTLGLFCISAEDEGSHGPENRPICSRTWQSVFKRLMPDKIKKRMKKKRPGSQRLRGVRQKP